MMNISIIRHGHLIIMDIAGRDKSITPKDMPCPIYRQLLDPSGRLRFGHRFRELDLVLAYKAEIWHLPTRLRSSLARPAGLQPPHFW